MRKQGMIWLALVCTAFVFSGCGGGSSGTSSTATSTAVTTKILLPGTARIGGRAAEAVVTGARVVLKLADGRKFTMTDSGNGNYTATISNIGDDFIIEARKGDLLLENMFADISKLSIGSSFDAGNTSATTTAYVEIARSVVKTLAAQMSISGLNVDNNLNLLSSLNNAQLNVDFLQLRDDVVAGTEPKYTQVVTSVATQLTTANTAATTPTSDDDTTNVLNTFVASNTYTNQVATVIAQVEIPQGSTDADSIRALINTLFTAFYAEDAATFLAGMSSTFLEDGHSKTKWITRVQTEDWPNQSNCTFTIRSVSVDVATNKTTASATALADNWCDGSNPDETAIAGLKSGETYLNELSFAKENGVWKFHGNQEKAYVELRTIAMKETNGSIVYFVSAYVDEASDYPISAVTLSGPGLSSVMSLVKETGENRWQQPGNHGDWIQVPTKPVLGDTYTFSVAFTGNASPTVYTKRVKATPRDTNFIVVTNPASGSLTSSNARVTLAWNDITPSVSEIGNLDIWFCGGNNCGFRISRWSVPPTTTTISVPTTGLTSGLSISGQICYDDYMDNETCTRLSLTYTGGT